MNAFLQALWSVVEGDCYLTRSLLFSLPHRSLSPQYRQRQWKTPQKRAFSWYEPQQGEHIMMHGCIDCCRRCCCNSTRIQNSTPTADNSVVGCTIRSCTLFAGRLMLLDPPPHTHTCTHTSSNHASELTCRYKQVPLAAAAPVPRHRAAARLHCCPRGCPETTSCSSAVLLAVHSMPPPHVALLAPMNEPLRHGNTSPVVDKAARHLTHRAAECFYKTSGFDKAHAMAIHLTGRHGRECVQQHTSVC